MKITRVEIKDFHQFKNVDIDLTYPKGHKKEGQPLDKICIIGQSGTGKTALLKIISGHTYKLSSFVKEYSYDEIKDIRVYHKLDGMDVKVHLGPSKDPSMGFTYWWDEYLNEKIPISFDEALKVRQEFIDKTKTLFIYFPADLHYEFESSEGSLSNKSIIDFREEKVGAIWNSVFEEIQKFQEQEIKLKQEIATAAVESNSDISVIQRAVSKLDRWRKKAENPIKKLADECLDPILKFINLRVKRNFSFESKGDIGIIKLEDLKGNEVPYNLLSTGTKQILLTALPLYLLKPDGTLILCDEPERSLYPSMQKIIIDYYASLTNNSQIFFATHSPIISSCFEPWEIVELKFDENGFVYQEKFYPEKSERHVDNYTIVPSYLTYDLILNKVFDLTETHSNERSEKITEALMLRNQLLVLKEKNKLDTVQGKKIYEKYRQLANKLFWDFDII